MKKIINHLKENWIKYGFETLVIIIGILGAFTLNNWNEGQKNQVKERILLTNLVENIQNNIDFIREDISTHQYGILSSDQAIDAIRNNTPFYDSLVFYFHSAPIFPDPTLSTSGYESLRSTGFDILSDELVRKEIIDLFEVVYPNMLGNLSGMRNLLRETSVPFYLKYFERSNGMARPNDYHELLGNQEYINHLVLYKSLHNWSIELKSKCLKESDRILKIIEEEIE
jgi:type II secretory pathway pseudopilin PulG